MSKATQIAIIMVLTATAASSALHAAEEEAAGGFVTLKMEGPCDDQNNRLWLTNAHTFKTIAATVRWRAAGGKDLQDQFFANPNSVREIGCASEAEILEAQFVAF